MYCTKTAYATKDDALLAMSRLRKKYEGRKKPIRAYCCDRCDKYHLSSQTRKQQQQARKRKNREQSLRIEQEADYYIKIKNWNSTL